jgi:hypothetical protein
VVASVRTVGQLLAMVAGALGSVAVWFVPMVVIQPGGLHAWLHAERAQLSAAHLASLLSVSSTGAVTNLATAGAWALVTVGPAVVVGVLAVLVVAGARVVTRRPGGDVSLRIWSTVTASHQRDRPWYQGAGVLLIVAAVPPVALVTVGHFAGGGDVLGFLVPVTILALLPVARVLHHRSRGLAGAVAVVASVIVAGAVVVNVQRFVAGAGILPAGATRHHGGLWIAQARYQAPYADTAAAIQAADRRDRQLRGLGALVDPATDVVACVSPGADAVFRTIDEELPDLRVALVHPYADIEEGGLLYGHQGATLAVGPGGHALFVVAPPAPVLATVASYGLAVRTPTVVDGLEVWRVAPGATLFGVTVTAVPGPRPL